MAVYFTPATPRCHELLAGVIAEYYPDLIEAYAPVVEPDDVHTWAAPEPIEGARRAAARIGLVMAHPDPESDKPAMQSKGIRILAKIKANSEAERVAGAPDATITLDAEHWSGLAEDDIDGTEKARALLDHELYHLEVRRNKDTKRIVTDDAGRPKFRMRPHDWEITGFRAVAERHKRNSAEVIVARRFHDEYGNILFNFAEEFAVQRDMDFAEEVLGLTEAAVDEINRDHEAAGMPRPFVGNKRPRAAVAGPPGLESVTLEVPGRPPVTVPVEDFGQVTRAAARAVRERKPRGPKNPPADGVVAAANP